MKKVILAGLCACVLLTGCGMQDQVEDMIQKIDAPEINTMEEARKVMAKEEEEAEYINSETLLEEIPKLKKVIEKWEKEGIVNTGEEEDIDTPYIGEWIQSTPLEMRELVGSEGGKIESGWHLQIKGEKNLRTVADELEKMGYEGMNDAAERALSVYQTSPEVIYSEDATLVHKGILLWMGIGEESYSLHIRTSSCAFCYPQEMKSVIESSLSEAYTVERVLTGGYLQRVDWGREGAQTENAYYKNIWIYLKDGEVIQMEIALRKNYETSQGKEGDLLNLPETFFREEECEALTGFLVEMGANEEKTKEFLSKASPSWCGEGEIGSIGWHLKEQKDPSDLMSGESRNWILRME